MSRTSNLMRFSCPPRLKKKSCHRVIANESGGVTIRTMRSRRKCTQVRRIKPEEGRLLPENGRGMQRLRTGLQRVRRRTSLSALNLEKLRKNGLTGEPSGVSLDEDQF